MDYSTVLQEVANEVSAGRMAGAEKILKTEYPFVPTQNVGRRYTPKEMTRVFVRDGFIDRYKGIRLVFPPVLRIFSHYFPDTFPYDKNGRMDLGHIAYWELFPTIDHVVPVARGGTDEESNWVCCSMLTNSIKSNWTMEQLQWNLLPVGNLAEWDGLSYWAVQQAGLDKELLNTPYLKSWCNAAKELLPRRISDHA